MGAGSQQQGVGSGGGASVAKVFDILTRGESGVAQQFEAVMKQEVGGSFAVCSSCLGPCHPLPQACWPVAVPDRLANNQPTPHFAQVEAVESMVEDAGQHNVALDQLSIALGPDLRAMYPLVMNFGVGGWVAAKAG
jgi:hypothetical protein